MAFTLLASINNSPNIVTDNYVFRFHYRVTVALLIAFALLLANKEYVGKAIYCISSDEISPSVLEQYCLIHGTFSVTSGFDKKVGKEVPYPGINKYSPEEDRVYYYYYQWVCIVLFIQAVIFYVPRHLWKLWEGERMKNLVLNLRLPILENEERDHSIKLLSEYLYTHMNYNNRYGMCYVIAEILNFANVLGQIYLLDSFLGHEFLNLGVDVTNFQTLESGSQRTNPIDKVFPKMTKCTFHRYGRSGDVQRHDVLCILPLNVFNEKIFLFLWFWFVILVIISGMMVGYRLITIASSKLRFHLLKVRANMTDPEIIRLAMSRTSFGDWFIIYLLSKNLDALYMRYVLFELSQVSEGKKSTQE